MGSACAPFPATNRLGGNTAGAQELRKAPDSRNGLGQCRSGAGMHDSLRAARPSGLGASRTRQVNLREASSRVHASSAAPRTAVYRDDAIVVRTARRGELP